MATYGVYSKDLKACYISGLDIIDAKRYLGGEDKALCLEHEVTSSFEVTMNFRKSWCWFIRPKYGYLEMGFFAISWRRLTRKKPYKVIPR